MTYQRTLEYLYSLLPAWHRIGKAAYKNDLRNSNLLDSHFGHPHRHYRTIHVGGTNGKGSVSHMTASVLQEAGLRTGLYTSPHLKDFRERIRVDGQCITEDYVVGFVEGNREIIETLKPSFFELTVALAFDYFASRRVEIAVIEVGLGGRLDSTNIITPELSVITNIGHDHMDLLGDTLVKVAREKAGIIKPGVPVIISESAADIRTVFWEKALECGSAVFFADDLNRCIPGDHINSTGGRQYEIIRLADGKRCSGFTPLGGDYQAANLQAVFEIFSFPGNRFAVSEDVLLRGIANTVKNTGLMGRWQVLSARPLTICDTGHNREGLEHVVRQLQSLSAAKLHIVLGFVNDKDLSSVLPLFPKTALYYFTRAGVPRALNQEELRVEAEHHGLRGQSYPDVLSAFSAARAAASADDIVFIGGSTFVVAEVL
ncbi:MAG: bifunctional folylpolyglutamate synthase/dihydrofolate synthase [Bacteroidales bacterium]|nr:bifunctional folylpolyglutamate synthase/dihydrofolate synthase [Bacteroidales bacterium]